MVKGEASSLGPRPAGIHATIHPPACYGPEWLRRQCRIDVDEGGRCGRREAEGNVERRWPCVAAGEAKGVAGRDWLRLVSWQSWQCRDDWARRPVDRFRAGTVRVGLGRGGWGLGTVAARSPKPGPGGGKGGGENAMTAQQAVWWATLRQTRVPACCASVRICTVGQQNPDELVGLKQAGICYDPVRGQRGEGQHGARQKQLLETTSRGGSETVARYGGTSPAIPPPPRLRPPLIRHTVDDTPSACPCLRCNGALSVTWTGLEMSWQVACWLV